MRGRLLELSGGPVPPSTQHFWTSLSSTEQFSALELLISCHGQDCSARMSTKHILGEKEEKASQWMCPDLKHPKVMLTT